jgi:hypothetical protein
MDTRQMLKSVEGRSESQASAETLVIASHITQMQQWVIRQGLHFYPFQDDSKESRKRKIDEVLKSNQIDLYYDAIVSTFLCSGSILWYLRPTGASGYEIHWYRGGMMNDPETQYKAYYGPGGRELQQVIIRYPYEDFSGFGRNLPLVDGNKKWVKLTITSSHIVDERHASQPSLTPEGTGYGGTGFGGLVSRTVQENSLGFIPCAVSPNFPTSHGDTGRSEFLWLSSAIENENAMRSAMIDNIFTFASPSLVTSRPKQQILEAVNDSELNTRPSWASQSGYSSASSPSTRKNDVWVREGRYNSPQGSGRRRVAKIIGGVMPDERFGYIFPDPINGDQWRFADTYREGIHECLGGIDPLGLKAGMTFGEVKSLYGKVAATANKKCRSLWTYGLSKILEMVVFVEEQIFIESYKEYLVTSSPRSRKFKMQVNKGVPISNDEILLDYVDSGMVMPPEVSGLAPFGDRTVLWRWSGPVFEKTSEDKQKDSIVVRNQQELGVGSLQAMQELFPEKEPREIEAMLTGVPFRFISSVSNSLGTLLQLQQQLSGIQDPQNPGYSLALRIDLTPVIAEQVASLQREISYGSKFASANDISDAIPSIAQPLYGASGSGAISDASAFNAVPDTGFGGVSAAASVSGLPTFQRGAIPANGTTSSPYGAASILGGFGGGAGGYSGVGEWQNPIPPAAGTVLPANAAAPRLPVVPVVPGIPASASPNVSSSRNSRGARGRKGKR